MRNDPFFRRGGFQSSSGPSDLPEPGDFIQVPACFTQGLPSAQWQAMQEAYQQAWERAWREHHEQSDSADGGLSYQI
jgi:hypothetical protein